MDIQALTETVHLPIAGKEAVIIEGDGRNQRIVLSKNKPFSETIPQYIASLTESIDGHPVKVKDILDLLVRDREFLQVELYKLNYGNMVEFKSICSKCGKGGDKVRGLDLSAWKFRPLPDGGTGGSDPTWDVTLPRTQRRATVGLMDGHKAKQLTEAMANSDVIDLSLADYLSLRALDGSTEFGFEEVVNLPNADHLAIRRMVNKLNEVGYDTMVRVVCESCGAINTIDMLLHPDFLCPGMG